MRTRLRSIDKFLIVIIGLLPLVPTTNPGMYIRIGVVIFSLLVIVVFKRNGFYFRNSNLTGVISLMIFSLLLPVAFGPFITHEYNNALVIHELERLIYNVMLMYIISTMKFEKKLVYKVCLFICFITFAIQIFQLVSPSAANAFIRRYYVEQGESGKHLLLSLQSGSGFRAGSIFVNPNICGQVFIICTPVFLEKLLNRFCVKNLLPLVMVIVAILLTGSRTAFLLFGILLLMYIFDPNIHIKSSFRVFVLVVIVIALIIFLFVGSDFLSYYRGSHIKEGLEDSLFTKFALFFQYVKNTSIIRMIFGTIYSVSPYQIDAEWGYIFEYFGLLGIIWFCRFIVVIYKRRCFNSRMMVAILALYGLTCTIMLSLSISSLFFFVALSNYVNESKVPDYKNEILRRSEVL